MLFETSREALKWYESEERVLTPAFLRTIKWEDVKNNPLPEEFVPVMRYMRDVERFTGMYYQELMRTPTSRDPAIRQFMDRWATEEPTHSVLLDRFLEEAGYPSEDKWWEKVQAQVPTKYRLMSPLKALLAQGFGEHFSAVHMTWGAINEYSTLTGYQRLWGLAKHPVLEYILRAIAREEARHSFFYWSVARIKLMGSPLRQNLTRFIVNHFWSPVGQGAKHQEDTQLVVKTLFRDTPGVAVLEQQVNRRIRELPGLEDVNIITEKVAASVNSSFAKVVGFLDDQAKKAVPRTGGLTAA